MGVSWLQRPWSADPLEKKEWVSSLPPLATDPACLPFRAPATFHSFRDWPIPRCP